MGETVGIHRNLARFALVVALVALAGTSVVLGGCAVASAPSATATAPASQWETATPEWHPQALRLASALQDLEDSVIAMPEAKPGTVATGTFEARIVSVSPTGGIVVDRQQYLTGAAAVQAAKLVGSSLVNEQFVTNKYPEKLTLRVAPDAAFVVWYPGEDATNVSSPEMAAMSALSLEQFAKLYASDSGKRQTLQVWGGWITVGENGVTSFVEPATP
jgi:hypothetical protein